jgi:hypothetical protein
MDEKRVIKTLTEMGGKLWEEGEYRRIYFDAGIVAKIGGLETWRYGTGNISSATLNGANISNSEAKRILSDLYYAKFWYDLTTGEWFTKGFEGRGNSLEVKNSFFTTVKAAIA